MRHGSTTMTLKPKFKVCSGDTRVHRPEEIQGAPFSRQGGAPVFWGAQGVMEDYLQRGATITGLYYADLIHKLRDAIKEKCRGKVRRKVLLHQDNDPSHKSLVAMAAISIAGFELLEHPPYSPDLAQSDYRLFQKLKDHLREKKFSSDNEAILSVNQWCAEVGQPIFQETVEKLEHCWEKCVNLLGD